MKEWLLAFGKDLVATPPLEWFAVGFAVAYVVLAAKQSLWCWLCAILSTALFTFIYYDVQLISESLLNVFYLLIAIYGWHQWRRGGAAGGALEVVRWSWRRHLLLIVPTALCVPLLAYWTIKLGAQLPYIDATTTCFAILATFLVTQKVLENWLYWVAIDLVGIYVNAARGLELSSLLMVVYVALAVYGYCQWRRSYQQPIPSTA